jgi:hypothetical protein
MNSSTGKGRKGSGSRGFSNRGVAGAVAFAFAAFTFASMTPRAVMAQAVSGESTGEKGGKSEQWIHVRVESKQTGGETVRVNVPVEMAAKVLPAIHNGNLKDGRVHIDNAHMQDVDIRALLDAVRTAKDGEYVTVQSNENTVRVAKSGGYLFVNVTDKEHGKKNAKGEGAEESKVEVKVPIKVVDALLSAGNDELDVVAALHALSAHGDVELVTVKDNQNVVRVWIDSKNVSN